MRARTVQLTVATLAAAAFLGALFAHAADDKGAAKLSESEAASIAEEAYVYGYPLVLMDITRNVSTAVARPQGQKAPVNQFVHFREFPDATFTDVVSPNSDMLYSIAWLDLTTEPMILSVPAVGNRYYVMQMMDAWTNVFADPGTRTTGNNKGAFAIVGPGWSGELPSGVQVLKSSTNTVWVIGRTQTNGKSDYPAVHAIQDQYKLVPASAWGENYVPQSVPVAQGVDLTSPAVQVAAMDGSSFLVRLNSLIKRNPPAAADADTVKRLAMLGVSPGDTFDPSKLDPGIARAIERGVRAARGKIETEARKPRGRLVNNWSIIIDRMGKYGTDYLFRSVIAQVGLGANLPEDALYPSTRVDRDGAELAGSNRYTIHFAKGQLPPVGAFWSLTMYSAKRAFVDNRINRYAIGDRDKLTFNEDGSLTLYIQSESPGREREPNWLPASRNEFNLVMRLYWPKKEILDGTWKPPAVERVTK
jgi:hypothetical protein